MGWPTLSRTFLLVIAILVGILAFLQSSQSTRASISLNSLRKFSVFSRATSSTDSSNMASRTPIYFVSHGGVSILAAFYRSHSLTPIRPAKYPI